MSLTVSLGGQARPQAILNGTSQESVQYRVTFKDIISLFYDREGRVSVQDKADAAQRRKEQGNGFFGVGAFRAALYKYAEAFDVSDAFVPSREWAVILHLPI